VIEFDEYLEDLASRCAEQRLESATRTAIDSIEHILEAHLSSNVPPENDLALLNWDIRSPSAPVDHDKDSQWDNVSRRYTQMIVRITDTSIKVGSSDLFFAGMMALGSVMDEANRAGTLGPRQKNQIIRGCIGEIERLVVEATTMPQRMLLMLYPLGSLRLSHWLDADVIWAKTAVLHLCRTLLRLGEARRLEGYSLNELGTLARGCIEHIDQDSRYAETVVLACDTFGQISRALDPPTSPADALVLREVEEQLKSLEQWFVGKSKQHSTAQARLNTALGTLRNIVVPDHLEALDNLKWPTIPPSAPLAGP
jgi:hypothetical protein